MKVVSAFLALMSSSMAMGREVPSVTCGEFMGKLRCEMHNVTMHIPEVFVYEGETLVDHTKGQVMYFDGKRSKYDITDKWVMLHFTGKQELSRNDHITTGRYNIYLWVREVHIAERNPNTGELYLRRTYSLLVTAPKEEP